MIFLGHRVLELSEKAQFIIDKLLFCSTHTEEPLKFYCNECKQILCTSCQIVTHRKHEILTIENALQMILPQAREYIDQIYLKQRNVEEGITKFEKQENDLKNIFKNKRECVDAKANEWVSEILVAQAMLKDELAKDESNEVKL